MTATQIESIDRIRRQVWQIFDAVSDITDDELDKLHKDIDADDYAKADENSDNLIAIEGHIVEISALLTKIEERGMVI